MLAFVEDPDHPGTRIWRRPARPSLPFFVAALVLAFLAFNAAPIVFRIIRLSPGNAVLSAIVIGLVVILCIILTATALAGWRIYLGSRELAIRLAGNSIDLTLPAHRSLAHRSPSYAGTLAVRDVRAIETRLELYSQAGAKAVSRSFRLVPRSGDPIFLLAEPVPPEDPERSEAKALIEEMAGHARVPLDDLGMVQSHAGVFGIWGAREAEWSATTLDTAEREVTWSRVRRSAKLMPFVIFGLIAMRFMIMMFRDRS